MIHNTSVGTELVKAICLQWPQLPSRTLARMLVRDNKGVWLNIEHARRDVRYRRGRSGAVALKAAGDNLIVSTALTVPHDPRKYIPVSEESDFLPFVLELNKRRSIDVAVLGDLHVPYHSISALQAVFADLDQNPPDVILLNGDQLDFYRLSRFMKDPRRRNTQVEIERMNEFLDALQERYPDAKIIWKDGNHDERYDHYLMQAAPELFGILKEHASLPHLLELEDRGIIHVGDKRPVYMGNLNVIHGHEFPTPVIGPVNAARGLFVRAKECTATNHHHQVSEHSEPTLRGKLIATWSFGCLCELHPEYARFNKWSHGFGRVRVFPNGTFEVQNKKIFEGRIIS